MKCFSIAVSFLLSYFAGFSQSLPISWHFGATKEKDNLYAVTLSAKLDPGWHIYAQVQPAEAISLPTKISFTRSPLVVLEGKTKEVGKMEKFKLEPLDIIQHQYKDSVDFVQAVRLKAKVKATISGTVTYQVCTDEKCLPPATLPFQVTMP